MTKGQQGVYDVLSKYGPLPDHALVPLAQHVVQTHLSSSGIRTRRKELVDLGLVGLVEQVADAYITMPSGRQAKVYRTTGSF